MLIERSAARKWHARSFAEYVPLSGWLPSLGDWSPHQGLYSAGDSVAPVALGRHRLATRICYEDIFPGVVRGLMRGGATRLPHALFNLTNDSWYCDTTEPMQHLVLASLRAVEHRRALVRATNTGISVIVDPVDRLDTRTAQWTRATLVGEVPMLEGRTVFGVLGDWLGWAGLLLTVAGLARGVWARRRAAA